MSGLEFCIHVTIATFSLQSFDTIIQQDISEDMRNFTFILTSSPLFRTILQSWDLLQNENQSM